MIHYSTATGVNAFLCAKNCKPEARADCAGRCAPTQTDVAQRKLNVMTFSKMFIFNSTMNLGRLTRDFGRLSDYKMLTNN